MIAPLALWLVAASGAAAAGAPSAAPPGAAPPGAAPAPASEEVLPGWRELYASVRARREAVGGPIVLAPAGDAARRVARRVEDLFPRGEVVLRPVPLVGDPTRELRLAQEATGLSCVTWIEPAPTGWRARPLGDCGAVAATAEEAPPPPTLLRYVPRSGEPPYTVVDEQGQVLDPWRYATLTRDPDLRATLITERRRRRTAARALEAAGVVVAASALLPLAASVGAEPELAEDRRFAAVFLGLSGGTLFLGGRLDRRGLEARQATVGPYVHPADAQAAVDDWNSRELARRLAAAAAPGEAAAGEEAPAEAAPEEDAPKAAAPEPGSPAEEAPDEEGSPAEEAPGEDAPKEGSPTEAGPDEEAPAEEASGAAAPAAEGPTEDTPAAEAPAEGVPAAEGPTMGAPVEEAP